MAQLGRLRDTLHRRTGEPAVGATVEVRRQGATVTANQSGTAPFVVTVADPGAIQPGDTVSIGTGTTTYDVDAIGVSTVTISGFAGTLAVLAQNRLTPRNALPTLYADSRAINVLPGGNPMTTDTFGEFAAWVDISPFDLRVSGGGYGDRLFQDVWPAGVVTVRVNCTPDPAGDGYVFDAKHLPSTGKIIRFQVDGVDKFFINADGTISGTVSVSVPDPLSLVNGLTVGGLTTLNGGAGIVGGLTVDNFTGTGTFTVAAGAIASAALANHAVSAPVVIVRGTNTDDAATTSEAVRVSTSYTPAGTNSNVMILFDGLYYVDSSTSNVARGEVRLYIDGVLAMKQEVGYPGSLGATVRLGQPVSLMWIATGLSNAAHTIEIRDLKFNVLGTLGIVTTRGTIAQSALIIQELKK